VRVRVEAFDPHHVRLGTVEGLIEPFRFTQIDDLFARVRAPRLEGALAQVTVLTGDGSLLAYASVIRGAAAPPIYLYPEPRPVPHDAHEMH
jgi:hypothetical protein